MGRRRGTSTFPVARIKKIMQADEDVGKIATATPVLVAKALECLMEDLLRDAATVAIKRRTKTVTPQHLKHSVAAEAHFDFLRPTLKAVPALDANTKDGPAAPARRGKRPRATPSPTPGAPARAHASSPTRKKHPPLPHLNVRPPTALDVALLHDAKRVRILPASSPVAVAQASASPPPITSPVPIPHRMRDDDGDDDDYDGDEHDAASAQPPAAGIAALRIHNAPLQPVIIRDFGLPPQARKAAAAEQRPSVTASERVSVHALLS